MWPWRPIFATFIPSTHEFPDPWLLHLYPWKISLPPSVLFYNLKFYFIQTFIKYRKYCVHLSSFYFLTLYHCSLWWCPLFYAPFPPGSVNYRVFSTSSSQSAGLHCPHPSHPHLDALQEVQPCWPLRHPPGCSTLPLFVLVIICLASSVITSEKHPYVLFLPTTPQTQL